MADTPRRRLADRVSSSPTFIGSGSRFTGDLECAGDLVVGGSVIGDGDVQGALTLSDGGRWEGELRASARIKGSLKARSIAVAKGAIIEGDMAVTSGSPVVHFEEKRGDR